MQSFAVFASLLATLCAAKSYDNHRVVRCSPDNRLKLDILHNLEESNDFGLDVWMEARRVGSPVDLMVSNKRAESFMNFISSYDIQCNTLIENVQDAINAERPVARGSSFFDDYHTSTEVNSFIDDLAAEFPSLATTSTIGKTYGGKPMQLITISTAPNTGKPALWFDGGLHAREWITVATVTYLADTLVRGYGVDGNATQLLNQYDIMIAPILNVDGYDYTWDEDRMWRKTRSPNGRACVGTDPNRNWEFHWGEAGSSPQSCSDSYQGPSPASEVEVQAIQSYLFNHKDVLKGYVNFHSYSQEWMSPWGYTDELPVDYEIQNGLSAAAASAIKATHGMEYAYGPISTTVYPASGSSADYAYGVCGIVYSYGVELRDTGKYGFLLPPDQIIPSGEEIYAAVIAMGNYISSH